MIMNMSVGVEMTSYNLMMCGWRNNFRIWISLLIFSTTSRLQGGEQSAQYTYTTDMNRVVSGCDTLEVHGTSGVIMNRVVVTFWKCTEHVVVILVNQ